MEEIVTLGQTLDISSVAGHLTDWRNALATNHPAIRVDATALAAIDTAGLQLLLAFQRDAKLHGKRFLVSGAGDALRSQAQVLGVAPILFERT
jgi:anti-anti-sigma regulatory factor